MGKRVVTTYLCDLCQAEIGAARREVCFGTDGVLYVLDLCDTDAVAVADTLGRWVSAGRSTGRYRSFGEPQQLPRVEPRGTGRPERSPFEVATIRRWANEQGMAVSSRGRVPKAVIERYDAAQAGVAEPHD